MDLAPSSRIHLAPTGEEAYVASSVTWSRIHHPGQQPSSRTRRRRGHLGKESSPDDLVSSVTTRWKRGFEQIQEVGLYLLADPLTAQAPAVISMRKQWSYRSAWDWARWRLQGCVRTWSDISGDCTDKCPQLHASLDLASSRSSWNTSCRNVYPVRLAGESSSDVWHCRSEERPCRNL
jgi:hypothetical protein